MQLDAAQSVAARTLDEAEKVAPQRKSRDYGTCDPPALESTGMIPDPNLCRIKLFVKTWGKFAPVIGSLVFIVSLNFFNPHELTMDCDYHHSFGVSLGCALTLPGVRLFPRMGLLLGCLLLAWRMAHERAYYILMKNRVIVDLDAGKRFGFWTTVFLALLFVVACCHFLLKFFYGHNDSRLGHQGDPNEYILKNTLAELLSNPGLLNNPENKEAQHLLNMAIMQFLTPAVLVIACLFGLLGIESELMPLSKMLESEPQKVYRDLGKFVFVRESTMRAIMLEGLESGSNESECVIDDVCQEVFEIAQKKGSPVLADPGSLAEAEKALEPAKSEVPGLTAASIIDHLLELLYIDWWPVKLLLERKLVDAHSVGFTQIMGIHYWITIFGIVVMMTMTTLRLIEYGRLIVNNFGQNWVMLIVETVLGLEVYFQITWLAQAQKYAMGVLASSRDEGEDTLAGDARKAIPP